MTTKKIMVLCQSVAACALWISGLPVLQPAARAQTAPAQTTPPAQTEKMTHPKRAVPVKTASDADIQAAKASGKVWVNTETKVYHKGGKWFGATKQGKFMTEQDAMKAGYRAAKNEK